MLRPVSFVAGLESLPFGYENVTRLSKSNAAAVAAIMRTCLDPSPSREAPFATIPYTPSPRNHRRPDISWFAGK